MAVRGDGSVELLAEEAEGVRFLLTDGVDVASDGTIYFTDASSKYNLASHFLDIMEGRPHGRLLRFDPAANTTTVLLRDLYFANGVALAPDQESLIVCETVVRRCMRYHLSAESKGKTNVFIENLPGFPDNIRYDGEGRYWIGIASDRSLLWDLLLKHPFLRKFLVVVSKFVNIPNSQKDGGVLSVSLDGKPISMYSDPGLHGVTGGLKVGTHLYFGLLNGPYMGRLDLAQN